VSAISDARRNLRKRSEYHLRLAVLRELGRDEPSTVEPYRPRGGAFWRMVFVPVYRRLPWRAKERAMNVLGMTAKGWQPPARQPGEPWRPPAPVTPPARPSDADANDPQAPPAA
jgi:hypothetical protein